MFTTILKGKLNATFRFDIYEVTGEIRYSPIIYIYKIADGKTLLVNDDFAFVNCATMEIDIGYPERLTKTDREM